ncbi:MAG: hypothetical protein WA160_02200 [Pseudobdellovibrio sp.]
MKIPNVKRFNSTVSFFSKVYSLNKENKSSFSYRVFAKKVNWPNSYLLDIIKGRKKLTLSRCLQFSNVFKFSASHTEYLISLCLAESDDSGVGEYFKSVLKNKDLNKEKNSSLIDFLKTVEDLRSIYLRELIIWGQGKKSIDTLLKGQIAYPDLLNPLELGKSLRYLMKENLITEIKPSFYKAVKLNKDALALDDEGVQAPTDPEALARNHIKQLQVLIRLMQFNPGKGVTFSSFLDFSVDRLPEVRDKLFELRDLLISFTKENKSEILNRTKCYQFEMHLVPMFDLDKIK